MAIPKQSVRLIDNNGFITPEWWRVLNGSQGSAEVQQLVAAIAQVMGRLSALEREQFFNMVGQFSVDVQGTPADGSVGLRLVGDVREPGARNYYGTNAEEEKGWHDVEVTLDNAAVLTNKTVVSPIIRGGTGPQPGPELVPEGGSLGPIDVAPFGNPPGWSNDVSGGVLHTPGTTDPLVKSLAVTPFANYLILLSWNSSTAGSLTVDLGGTSFTPTSDTVALVLYGSSGTPADFSVIPTSDFDGIVAYMSVQEILPSTDATRTTLTNSAGSANEYIYTPGGNSIAIGLNTLAATIAGISSYNFALGANSLDALQLGSRNTAIGADSNTGNQQIDSTTAIGSLTNAASSNATAIGAGATVGTGFDGAVAVGSATQVTRTETVAVGPRDVHVQGDGLGVILKTPDGTAEYRLSVDNAGAPVTTLL